MEEENPFKSQFGQDKYLLKLVRNKKNGYFVELGACDGILHSNSYYFEKKLNWEGILIEPNPIYWEDLNKNRNCKLSNGLCDDVEGKEVDFLLSEAMSGIVSDDPGYWVRKYIDKEKIKLKTTTLSKILDELDCHRMIDFLSLDVEGAEYNILVTFPFDKYQFRYICVEHNEYWDGDRHKNRIYDILSNNNYLRIKETEKDDFYKYNKERKKNNV